MRGSKGEGRQGPTDPSSSSLFSLRLELVTRSRRSSFLALCTSPLLLGLRGAQLSLWVPGMGASILGGWSVGTRPHLLHAPEELCPLVAVAAGNETV